MGKLLVFSGTDGAGKSTQIAALANVLADSGMHTIKFWARGGYTPLFSSIKSLIRRFRPSTLPKPGRSVERSQRFHSTRVRRVWLVLAILDLFLCYSVWLRLRLLAGNVILCDRYIVDTLLDFRRNYPQENVAGWLCWRILERTAPTPDHQFLLIVPPVESLRRSALKNEPFPDDAETLEWRYERYQELAKLGQWFVLDGLKSFRSVHEQILRELQQ
jgi:thymidylate kinase